MMTSQEHWTRVRECYNTSRSLSRFGTVNNQSKYYNSELKEIHSVHVFILPKHLVTKT